MSLADIIEHAPSSATLALWLQKVPYAAYLGIEAQVDDDDILFLLPPDDKLIGNPGIRAIHGGVIGAFMEQAAAFHLIARMENPVLPKIIDFSPDYLRANYAQHTYARCKVTRQGRSVANVHITAWQDEEQKPTATARAHFLIDDELT